MSKVKTFAIDAVIYVRGFSLEDVLEHVAEATGEMVDNGENTVTRVEFFDGSEVDE